MMKIWGAVVVVVLCGALTGCGGESRSSCDVMVETGVSRGAGMEDVDRALRACGSVAEFEGATAARPGLIDGDAGTVVANRCRYNTGLRDYPICK